MPLKSIKYSSKHMQVKDTLFHQSLILSNVNVYTQMFIPTDLYRNCDIQEAMVVYIKFQQKLGYFFALVVVALTGF